MKCFHSLRHTFVSRLTNADVSPDVRKALAGHDTDEAHTRYTNLALTKQTEAWAKLVSRQVSSQHKWATLPRMRSADAVQTKGFGARLFAAM